MDEIDRNLQRIRDALARPKAQSLEQREASIRYQASVEAECEQPSIGGISTGPTDIQRVDLPVHSLADRFLRRIYSVFRS